MLTLHVLPGPAPGKTDRITVTTSWEDDSGWAYARGGIGPNGHWVEWDGLGLFEFRPPEPVVSAWPSEGVAEDTLRSVFERFLQPIVLQAMGHTVLHASGILAPSGAIVFCGVSGSGKSTLAYGLGQAGCRQFADDAVVINTSPADITVSPLPFVPRLRQPAAEALGNRPEPRVAFCDSDAAPRLAAIVLLAQDPAMDTAVRVQPIPPHKAFAQVLTHAHSFDPDSPAEAARLSRDYLDLVARVPVVGLRYKPDFSKFERLVASVLDLTGDAGNRHRPESAVVSRS
jgi:hypothetical protein